MNDFKCCISNIIPTVYDDSLSYQELIGKLCLAVKNIAEYVEIIGTSLDTEIEQKVNTVVQELIDSGEFNTIISNAIGENLTYFSVKHYGAFGDGKTDDTLAIQTCINNAKKYNKRVYIPDGIYLVSSPLKLPSNITIVGSNATLKLALGNAIMINDSNGNIGGTDANTGITIDGLSFDGSMFTATLVALGHANHCVIKNCVFQNLKEWHFIELNACNLIKIEKCFFYNYVGDNTTEMLQIDGAFDQTVFPWFGPYDNTISTSISITECTFKNAKKENNAGIGNHTLGTSAHAEINITNCVFENLEYGLSFISGDDLKVHGCTFIKCGLGNFKRNVMLNFIISNNEIYQGTVGLNAITLQNSIIANNNFNCTNTGINGNFVISEIIGNIIRIDSTNTQKTGINFSGNGSAVKNNIVYGANPDFNGGTITDCKIIGNVFSSVIYRPNGETEENYFNDNIIKRTFDFNATNTTNVNNSVAGSNLKTVINVPVKTIDIIARNWNEITSFTPEKGIYLVNVHFNNNFNTNQLGTIRIICGAQDRRMSFNFNYNDPSILGYVNMTDILICDGTNPVSFAVWTLYAEKGLKLNAKITLLKLNLFE